MIYRIPKTALATSVIATGLLVACGGGGGGGGGDGTGTLSVSLTDAPACGFDEVNVKVNKVRVHRSANAEGGDSGWTDIIVDPNNNRFNLLELTNGLSEVLGNATLPAGRYTQLRLVLDPNTDGAQLANSVVPTGGTETKLQTPSALTSGIKLNGNFEITEGSTTALMLDFDACKSIVTKGSPGGNGNTGYLLKPVINIIPIATSGVVTGYISPTIAATSNPVVSAQVNGQIIRSTVPDPTTGLFSLSPITAGTYDIVVSADSHASDVITDVPVTANSTTALSTDTAPLALTSSTMANVSGKVTPADEEVGATVSATQTFSSGKKVVIKYQNADVTTGDYSMSLPNGAPRIGAYGTGTLPLAVSPETGLAGKYSMEASATG